MSITSADESADVRVVLEDRSSDRRCLQNASIVATPAAGADGVSERAVPARSTTSIRLPRRDSWRLRVSSEGCWSTAATWHAAAEPAVMIELFPAAILHGTFATPSDTPPPRLQASAFRVTAQRNRKPLDVDPDPLDCSLDFPKWQCSVPAELPIDVRLEPDGFAPLFVWSFRAEPGQRREADRHTLVRGSSLAGWVEDADGNPLPAAALTLAILQGAHPDADRSTPLRYAVKTDARGFFHFRGIQSGEYRLSSRAAGWAPVVVPALTIRAVSALTWPRALRHLRPAELTVNIDPPTTRDGAAWAVRVTERITLIPGEAPRTTTLSHTGEGSWSGAGLRSDWYELTVTDPSGTVVEKRDLDLSIGTSRLALSVHALDVEGVVKLGDEPLAAADLRFVSNTGKAVFAKTGEDGEFHAAFPSPGRWRATVYPKGRGNGAEIRVPPVEIARQPTERLEIILPGARLRGRVVQDGAPAKAAVHLTRAGTLVAQELTGADGTFEFLGLPEATYSLAAEGDTGATRRALDVRIDDGQTIEREVVLERFNVVRAVVRTPAGEPASGAIARISTDGGIYWSELVLSARGELEYFVPSSVPTVDVIIVTYSHPAAMARLSAAGGRATITLPSHGGKLRVQPDRVFIFRDGFVAPLNAFYLPSNLGLTPVAHLETGSYAVCSEPRRDAQCQRVAIAPGTSAVVEMQKGAERGE